MSHKHIKQIALLLEDATIDEAGLWDAAKGAYRGAKEGWRNDPASLRSFNRNQWNTPAIAADPKEFINQLASNDHFIKVSKMLGAGNPAAFGARLFKVTNGQKDKIPEVLNQYFSKAVENGRFGDIYKAYPMSIKSLSAHNATTVFDRLPGKMKQKYMAWLINKMITPQAATSQAQTQQAPIVPQTTTEPRNASKPAGTSQKYPDDVMIDRVTKVLISSNPKSIKIGPYETAIAKSFGVSREKSRHILKQAFEKYRAQRQKSESKLPSINIISESLDILHNKPIWHN